MMFDQNSLAIRTLGRVFNKERDEAYLAGESDYKIGLSRFDKFMNTQYIDAYRMGYADAQAEYDREMNSYYALPI